MYRVVICTNTLPEFPVKGKFNLKSIFDLTTTPRYLVVEMRY
jgi:hypothetical protein